MPIPYTWVYLIHDEFTNLYKIGKSDAPEDRLKTLLKADTIRAAPPLYTLVEAWLCPEHTERNLHIRFSELRERGEWFRLGEDELLDINILNASYDRWVAENTLDYENLEWQGIKDWNEAYDLKKEVQVLRQQLRPDAAQNADAIDLMQEGLGVDYF